MRTRSFTWSSECLGREASLFRWGWYGKPVLLLPTTRGSASEVFDYGLAESLSDLVEVGRVKVYAVGCPEAGVWMDRAASGEGKARSQQAFADHLYQEVVPRIRQDCESEDLRAVIAGVNVGAHSAVNAAAKHPDAFDVAIGMSGTYDFDRWMEGYFDTAYYFNQPLRFLPNLEGEALDQVRQSLFVLASGTGRWENPEHTRRLAGVLQAQRIPVSMELWGPDADHDWKTWRTMLPLFLDRLT